jgi:futalosine hydrolase
MAGEAAPGGGTTLVLVPTELERRRIEDQGGLAVDATVQALCGFGPVAAAARTASILATLRPARTLLVGIAGAYDVSAHPVGEAFEFDACAIDGVGVGEGPSRVGPPALGFPQWPGDAGSRPIFDRLRLATNGDGARLLLTTCAASANVAQAAERRERFPHAVAEDMEGFAVATACALHGIPLRIVRGISNRAGDRERERWRIPATLAAAQRVARAILESGAGWTTAT